MMHIMHLKAESPDILQNTFQFLWQEHLTFLRTQATAIDEEVGNTSA